jgi:HAD superfamily hydrolase (TIGR01450 family)
MQEIIIDEADKEMHGGGTFVSRAPHGDKVAICNKKLFLLDMDGTIYIGNRLFDSTLPFLNYITRIGAKYAFITNNSSKSTGQYLKKLSDMNIPATSSQLITSTLATAIYLKSQYGGKPIYASGTQAFVRELIEFGLNIICCPDSPISKMDLDMPIAALVMGFDTELSFQKLENLCILLGKGIDYIATNPDLTCPTEYGQVPDCGSVAQILKNATGRQPIFIGKPTTSLPDIALERTGFSKEEALVIGDRLYMDIACGINSKIDTALVLSGDTTQKDLEAATLKPTYVFEDLGQLLEALEEAHGHKIN